MRSFSLAAAALLAATGIATAQTQPTMPSGDTTQQTTPGTMPAQPGTTMPDPDATPPQRPADPSAPMAPATPADQAQPMAPDGASPAAPPTAGDTAMSNPPAATASDDFGRYDSGAKGYLTALDYASMKAAASGEAMPAPNARMSKRDSGATVAMLNRYGGDFMRADVNRDGRVTADEIAAPIAMR